MTAQSIFQSMRARSTSNLSLCFSLPSERFWIKYAGSWDASREVRGREVWFLWGPWVERFRWLARYGSLIRADLISGIVIPVPTGRQSHCEGCSLELCGYSQTNVLCWNGKITVELAKTFQSLIYDKKMKIKLVSRVSKWIQIHTIALMRGRGPQTFTDLEATQIQGHLGGPGRKKLFVVSSSVSHSE